MSKCNKCNTYMYLLFSADLVVGAYESQLVVLFRYEREREYHVHCNIASFCRSLPVITVVVNIHIDVQTPVPLDSMYVHIDNNAVWWVILVSIEFGKMFLV